MNNITLRSNFLTKENVMNVDELDLGSLSFGDFDFGKLNYYILKPSDVCRPDLISYKIYGTTNYWWFLMWFNGVCDIWNDLRENMVIKYPDLELVREAFNLYRKK